ncbi:hypothetical protein DMB66_11585 [Actinoplanes sp. ATCC 53533]|nr:hypothetical protein DMB66_11585 [Actinoplanes sp. ATCC 53533]
MQCERYRYLPCRRPDPDAAGPLRAEELKAAGRDDVLSELADLREVLAALTTAFGFTGVQVKAVAASKRSVRDGFSRRLWLQEVRIP